MPVTGSLQRVVSPLPLMLALTFSTGIVDAVGYLGLDRVFTGNMTGNVVILAEQLALSGTTEEQYIAALKQQFNGLNVSRNLTLE